MDKAFFVLFFYLRHIYVTMNLSFLPKKYVQAIRNINYDDLYEIRMRASFPVKVKIKTSYYYLTELGSSLFNMKSIICTKEDIDDIVKNVTECSIYAHNDKIKNGYLTTHEGIRIGVAGECVSDNDKIITIKNFSSLNIRIPHEIYGCANILYKYVYDAIMHNSIIISPPLFGKTTLLKDLIRIFNERHNVPILVIDERGEFSSVVGENIDTIRYSDKNYSFSCGIRVLAPSIVITDELCTKSDWECVSTASNSGVKVIASCHGQSLQDVIYNKNYIKGVFERFIVLKNCGQAGVIDKVYNGDYKEI